MSELHLPGYNYVGPGTALSKRLFGILGDSKRVPINEIDRFAMKHDLIYMSVDADIRNEADRILLEDIKDLPDLPVKKLVNLTFKTKQSFIGKPKELSAEAKSFVAKAIGLWQDFDSSINNNDDKLWAQTLKKYVDVYRDISQIETRQEPQEFIDIIDLLKTNNPYNIDLAMIKVETPEEKADREKAEAEEALKAKSLKGPETKESAKVIRTGIFAKTPSEFRDYIKRGSSTKPKLAQEMYDQISALKHDLKVSEDQHLPGIFSYDGTKVGAKGNYVKANPSKPMAISMAEYMYAELDAIDESKQGFDDYFGLSADEISKARSSAIGALGVQPEIFKTVEDFLARGDYTTAKPRSTTTIAEPTAKEISQARTLIQPKEKQAPLPFVPKEIISSVREEKTEIRERPMQVIGDLAPSFAVPSKEILQPSKQAIQNNQKQALLFNYVMPGQFAPGTDIPQDNGLLAGNLLEENIRYHNAGMEVDALTSEDSGNFILSDIEDWLREQVSNVEIDRLPRFTIDFNDNELSIKTENPVADYQSSYNDFTDENQLDVDLNRSTLIGIQS